MVGDHANKIETLNRPVSHYTGEFSFVSKTNINTGKFETKGTIDVG
jgi:hypothetical protein